MALGCKYRAVTESVEIVISGDHEREVIGICGCTLIAVIICRPCFFFRRVFSRNYLTRSLAQRGRAIVHGLRVKIELLGFKSRGRMSGVCKSKDEYLLLEARKQILPAKRKTGGESEP